MASWRVIVCSFLILTSLALIDAEAQRERSVQSPSHTIALLELYTSEG